MQVSHEDCYGQKCLVFKEGKQYHKQNAVRSDQARNQEVNRAIAHLKCSKTCLFVRYNMKLQSFCPHPKIVQQHVMRIVNPLKISAGCVPGSDIYKCS